ncbi:hypothetical protein CANINC_002034 [Pichia inconspicua]|uniref:Uncharacterized protein n=1 Tax=Pichia inconspicua TaxID=52247 RepID=A0A4T0X241_9ASCO|nr:hypothetical protein CANINC_002034 [[Candida] inconspicua]
MQNRKAKSLDELKLELEKFKRGEKIHTRSRTTPLAKLFDEISKKINGYEIQNDVISHLYSQFYPSTVLNDKVEKRRIVISQLLDYLAEINRLSEKKEGTTIISIPLYDIRIVGELANLIIIHGIYSIMPQEYLIPLEQRKLQKFKSSVTFSKIDFTAGKHILEIILRQLTSIFESNSDLKDLILVGTGFTDTLAIAIFFSTFSPDFRSYIQRLEAQSSTYQLLSFYSLLYKNSKKNTKHSVFVLSLLSNQLLKPNGIESLIDLVLGLREDEEVDVTKIDYIVQILILSRPANLSITDYYKNIFDQLYKMLVLVNRPLMNTVIVRILVTIFERNKNIVNDFFFRKIWHCFKPQTENMESLILTNEVELNNAFNVCISLTRSLLKENDVFINQLFEPILLSLWYYLVFKRKNEKDFEIVLNLMKNIIVLGDSSYFFDIIISNLLHDNILWKFSITESGLILIKSNFNEECKTETTLALFDEIDYYTDSFMLLLTKLDETDSKYLDIVLTCSLNKAFLQSDLISIENPSQKVIYLKLIQMLLDNFRPRIEGSPMSIIAFLNTYLDQYFESSNTVSSLRFSHDDDSDDEDEEDVPNDNDDIMGTILPILDLISTYMPQNEEEATHFKKLQKTLKLNDQHLPGAMKQLAQQIISVDTETENIFAKNKFNIETIVKQINDPTPSIRVYALDNLTQYTVEKDEISKVVSTRYTFNLMLSQLKDSEPFVYLNSIKNLVVLVSFDRSLLMELLKQYSMSKRSIDEKLRIGEVLSKFIIRNGKVLRVEEVKEILDICFLISRFDSDLQKRNIDNKDTRMKMSSLSILGFLCCEVGFGISSYIDDIADLIQGIITFEKNAELRRAAVCIIGDIVKNENGLELIKPYGEKLQVLLEYITEKEEDLIVCQNAIEALNIIEDAFEKRLLQNS